MAFAVYGDSMAGSHNERVKDLIAFVVRRAVTTKKVAHREAYGDIVCYLLALLDD
jgi:hypothetical protein